MSITQKSKEEEEEEEEEEEKKKSCYKKEKSVSREFSLEEVYQNNTQIDHH